MTLQQFIKDRVLTTEAFAQAVGISQPYAWRLVNDPTRTPSPQLAMKIEAWSGGAVRAVDLCPLIAEIAAMPKARRRAGVPA